MNEKKPLWKELLINTLWVTGFLTVVFATVFSIMAGICVSPFWLLCLIPTISGLITALNHLIK